MRDMVLPGYEVLGQLGVGGFGEVRLARHERLDRLVAVKRLRSFALDDDGAAERFRREALVLAQLRCPSVVAVYDFVVRDGEALLVMEYVPGRPLDEVLAGGEASTGLLLDVLDDVAEALRAAAERGIVHRDIKPANVFVTEAGRAKLGDFGLARLTGDSAAFRTAVGLVSGTPAYLPPEIAAGAEPDARSDAYSFAVMAYEALVGRLPFDGASVHAMAAAHASAAPPPPSSLRPDFPPAAEPVLLAGLEKEPGRRPLSHEVMAALRRSMPQPAPTGAPAPGRGVLARAAPAPPAPGVPRRAPRSPFRRRPVGFVALVAVGVVAVGVVLVATGAGRASPTTVTAVDVAVEAGDPGTCPAATYTFAATIRTTGDPGDLQVRWTQPDGVPVPPSTLTAPGSGHDATARLRFTVSGERPLSGVARVEVGPPGSAGRAAVSPSISYRCR